MHQAIIIPARFRSTRLPGKPLVSLAGRPMILHVWDKCIQASDPDSVFIATDDDRIASVCDAAGANVIMTSPDHLTGTDRIQEVSQQIHADVYVNVQGDEPLVDPDDIRKVIGYSEANPEVVVNACTNIVNEQDFYSRTVPKVVFDKTGKLLYITRAPIPGGKNREFKRAWRQVCIYAFPRRVLQYYGVNRLKSQLEEFEDIEILRLVEHGITVQMVELPHYSISVDTEDDVQRVEQIMARRSSRFDNHITGAPGAELG